MKTIFSTAGVRPSERFDSWHASARQYVIDHDPQPDCLLTFEAKLSTASLDDITLVMLGPINKSRCCPEDLPASRHWNTLVLPVGGKSRTATLYAISGIDLGPSYGLPVRFCLPRGAGSCGGCQSLSAATDPELSALVTYRWSAVTKHPP
jgi:hypothetical protein